MPGWYKSIDVKELKILEDKIRKIILHVKCGDQNDITLAIDELMKIRHWLEGLDIELLELKGIEEKE